MPASVAPRLLGRLRAGPIRFHPAAGLVERALVLAVALHHPIDGCMYVSLAFARDARVVTCDPRFLAAARAAGGLASRVVLLSELSH